MPTSVSIPTEPIGRTPRLGDLLDRIVRSGSEDPALEPLYKDAIRDTVDTHIETPEEMRDRSFEPGKDRRGCEGDT